MRVLTSGDEGFPSPQEWDEFSARPPWGHMLQCWTWGQLKGRFGWRPVRTAVMEGERIVAAAQVLFRPLPGVWWSTGYVPRGPLVDLATSELATVLLSRIHDVCRHRHAVSLKVEPDWEDAPQARRWLAGAGFVPSEQTVQPRRTVLIDLTTDEEAILAQMKSKTRYNIRLAERKEVSVRLGTVGDLSMFYRLLEMTGRRNAFGIHTRDYYMQAWRLFAAHNAVALLVAEYKHTPLAALMVFAWGDRAWYMYGASSDDERQRMPNHLLQWEAMRWAKARGCRTYDLWGIPDLEESEIGDSIAEAEESGVLSRGMGGLYRFKRGFGGREVRCVGAYDYVYSQPLYRLLTMAWNWWTG